MVAGTRLQGRYVLEERIAVGGMGSVMAATDERLGRRVAVKLLKEELAHDPRFVERFRREARAVASLSHANIASVFDYGEHDGRRFIVMELAPGHDLGTILREQGRMSPDRAVRIAAQICEALSHAHAAGIVHRDVKPANVIVDGNGRVKVTDFGIARAAGDARLTATGSVMGTAQYISPEQASGQEVGPATDQYSMGVVLYEMLTGEVPFSGDSPLAVAMRHSSDPIPPPSHKVPVVPPELDAVVARATEKDPSRRYPDARALGAAMVDAVAGPSTEPMAAQSTHRLAAAPAAAGGSRTERLAETERGAGPAPAARWNPERIGLVAVLALLGLGILAALIFLGKILTDEPPATSQRHQQPPAAAATPQESTPSPSPTQETAAIPADIIGEHAPEAEKQLRDAGFTDVRQATGEFDEDFDPGEVIASNPEPGSTVNTSDPVTLYVNPPRPEEHKPPGGEHGPHDKGKGHDKHDD